MIECPEDDFYCQCEDEDSEAESCWGCREEKCTLRVIPWGLEDLIARLEVESQSDLPPEKRNDQERLRLVEAVGMLGQMLSIHFDSERLDEAVDNPAMASISQNERAHMAAFMILLMNDLRRYFGEV